MTRLASAPFSAPFGAALALATAALAGAPGLARANPDDLFADAIFDPLTMDHHTPVSTLDADFSYVAYDEPRDVDVTVMGITIAGQYVTSRGVGGYLSIPMSYLAVDTPLNIFLPDDSALALGNLEIGGLWSKFFGSETALVLHAGLALPTASDDEIAAYQALASSPRWGNFVERVPNSTWLRLGLSPMGRIGGKLFWRADLGVDLALDEDDPVTYSPVLRVNLGGGVDLGTAHLLAELVTNVLDTDPDTNDNAASTLAIGARFLAGNLRPGIGIILPIDFNAQVLDPDFAITLSLAARL